MGTTLSKYQRPFKLYVQLPSGLHYYDDTVINRAALAINNEVGVRAITGTDEMQLRNPDALFNGEAIVNIIKSCVPAILNPRKLLQNDIEVLFLAIKCVSYGETTDVATICPECGHENEFQLSLRALLETVEKLEPDYTVDLTKELRVHLKPHDFQSVTRISLLSFRQSKLIQSSNLDEPGVLEAIQTNPIFEEMVKLNAQILAESITAVDIIPEGVTVTDRDEILQFAADLESSHGKKITETLEVINKVGISTVLPVSCAKCNHEWMHENLQLSADNFFG